jgi:hypothetical protein
MSEPQETGIGQKQERIEKPQASSSKPRKVYVLGVAFVAVLLLGASFGIMISATTPSIPTVIEPGSMVTSSTFVIFKDGSTTYALDGETGEVSYNSVDSATVFQNCIDTIELIGGGSIYVKYATYTIVSMLNLSVSNIKIESDFNTTLTASILPILTVWGVDFDSLIGITKHNIQIENLNFYYTGLEQTGNFLYFHKLQSDRDYGGVFNLRNLKIQGGVYGVIPTNPDFVGLCLEDIMGGTFENLQISGWGTGLKFNLGMNAHFAIGEDSEQNLFDYININHCYYGVWEESYGGHNFYEQWTRPKIMVIVKTAMIICAQSVTILEPDITEMNTYNDSTYQVAINSTAIWLSVIGGQIYGVKDVDLRTNTADSRNIISNVHFGYTPTAMYNRGGGYLILTGNLYSGITTKVDSDPWANVRSTADGFLTENHGTAYVTGANNTITIAHGLLHLLNVQVTPYLDGSPGYWYISYQGDPAYFQITFENQPGASTWIWYWVAYGW